MSEIATLQPMTPWDVSRILLWQHYRLALEHPRPLNLLFIYDAARECAHRDLREVAKAMWKRIGADHIARIADRGSAA